MPRSVVVLSLAAVLTVAASADAQYFGRNKVHYDQLDFRVLRTEHFDIHYYDEEEVATRHAARMAERWYARFSMLLDHRFNGRQTLVLYASHPHFTQTNLTAGTPGEGIGGFTERSKSRIAMPFVAGLGETDHVLGHEIAHAFQIDIAKRARRDAFALPGWFIEGMAEFLSLGPVNTQTDMWLHDAALNDALPTLAQLESPRYFPYRFGHALWSYLATKYGDEIVGRVLRSRTRNVTRRLEEVTGATAAEITAGWHRSIRVQTSSTDGIPPAKTILRARDGHTRLHLAPSLSPDGKRLMFLSERDRLSLDLFMADAATGTVLKKIVGTAGDPHFDSLQYIHSAGAWDPEGTRFAFAALGSGNPVLTVVDVENGTREEYALDGLGEIYNPSWSPDGTRLVFSALKDGLSDLFVFTLKTRSVARVTNDPFADLHPAWSPDGHRIAFATDRFTTSLDDLRFGALRVAILDLRTGEVRQVVPEVSRAKQVNPQWTPDGHSLYFISDRDGVNNVFRLSLADGDIRQITAVRGGVSGITATSPAIAVASSTGTLAYSVYRAGRYEIRTLDAASAMEGRLVARADDNTAPTALAPATSSLVSRMLANPDEGLPSGAAFEQAPYDDKLRLESVSQPYVGAATGNTFGGALRASFGFTFGDMLRDRQLQSLFRVGTDLDDFAVQVGYMNRRRQWMWGAVGGVMPSRFYGARRSMARDGELVTRETTSLRYSHQWAGLTAHYAVSRAQRVEFGAGVRRTGFEWQTYTRVNDLDQQKTVSRKAVETPGGAPIHLAEAHMAFVRDTTVFGATSPVLGERYRFEVDPAFGGLTFADVRLDYRKYVMPVKPFTLAARVEHVGRYGPGAADPRLTPLVYSLQTLVRGYDLRSFAADECGFGATSCSMLDELTGSRLALLNLELRAPLAGILSRTLEYGRLPIEAIAFVDAGFLWTRRSSTHSLEYDRFRSVGAGARANLGGIVFEVTGARPFDRVRSGWTVSFLLRPGF